MSEQRLPTPTEAAGRILSSYHTTKAPGTRIIGGVDTPMVKVVPEKPGRSVPSVPSVKSGKSTEAGAMVWLLVAIAMVAITLAALAASTNGPGVRRIAGTITTNAPGGTATLVPPTGYPNPILDSNGVVIWPSDFWEANSNNVARKVVSGAASNTANTAVSVALSSGPRFNLINGTNMFPDIPVAEEGAKPTLGFDTYYSGWNGSNIYSGGQTSIYCAPSEGFVLQMATGYVSDGLLAAGYNTISISDGWEAPARDGNGALTWNTTRFPNGIPWLVRKLHGMGFKVRMYTDLNTTTCCGALGTTNYPLDAKTYTDWGIDSLTVDTCGRTAGSDDAMRQSHLAFMAALAATNAHMIYDIHCAPITGGGGNWTNGFQPWMARANSWQFTTEWGTIADTWKDVLSHVDMAAATSAYMRPGHGPNLLVISGDMTLYSGAFGRLVLSMWSMFQSPLVFGQDFVAYNNLLSGMAQYQTNKYCLQIDQDALWLRPWLTFTNGANTEGWTKLLSDGSTALCIFNRGTNAETLAVDLTAMGIATNGYAQLVDCWNYTNLLVSAGVVSMSSPGRGCSLWLVSPGGRVTKSQQVASWQVPAAQMIDNGPAHFYSAGGVYDVLNCPTATTSWFIGCDLPMWARRVSVSMNAYWAGTNTVWTNRVRAFTAIYAVGGDQIVETNFLQRIAVTNGHNVISFPDVWMSHGGHQKTFLVDATQACTNGSVSYLEVGRMDVRAEGEQ